MPISRSSVSSCAGSRLPEAARAGSSERGRIRTVLYIPAHGRLVSSPALDFAASADALQDTWTVRSVNRKQSENMRLEDLAHTICRPERGAVVSSIWLLAQRRDREHYLYSFTFILYIAGSRAPDQRP
jgi:hypothetical protein